MVLDASGIALLAWYVHRDVVYLLVATAGLVLMAQERVDRGAGPGVPREAGVSLRRFRPPR